MEGPSLTGEGMCGVHEDGGADWGGGAKAVRGATPVPALASSSRDRQEASYDGVLGGHACVSDADVRESATFLRGVLGAERYDAAAAGALALTAVDCGAGVGRVSEQLLLRVFATVDVLEPSGHLIAKARTALAAAAAAGSRGAPGEFFQAGLQAFHPEPGRYDVIWVQWAMLYLTDGEK